MRMRKWIPAFCLAMGLGLAVPMMAGATGETTLQTEASSEQEEAQEVPGWNTDEHGKYFIQDGKRLTAGFYSIDGKMYYFNVNGYLNLNNPGPQKIGETNYYFFNSDGSVAGIGLYTFNDKNYCVENLYGLIAADKAVSVNGNIYCTNKDGTVITGTGLVKVGGKQYYLRRGVARTNFKKTVGNKTYYFGPDGSAASYILTKKNNRLFYKTSDGKAKKGWFKDSVSGKRYYAASNGRLKTGWQKYKKKWYYFDTKTGAMKYGWVKSKGKYYYLNPKTGVMKTGWFKVNGNKYYGTVSGSSMGARYTGFNTIKGKRYYFNNKGVLQKGWVTVSGKKYYLSSKGVVTTGWKKISGKYYYFETDGQMRTGWLLYKGAYYYLNPKNGVMVTGKKKIDGVTYTFSSSGASNREISGSYSIRVNRQQNVITIYKGGVAVKAMLCSTGLNNATPAGNFQILDKLYLHELNGPTYGYYCSHITSDILFHSIPAPTTDRSKIPSYKFNMLGQAASQGCIRLAMGDAYWIYQNCPVGTPVTIYDSPDPGPLGKPTLVPMSTNPTYGYDPTDPTR